MSQANPFDVFDSAPAAPRVLTGPPPVPEKPDKPPAGYRQGVGGLEPIPGGPADPNKKDPPSGYRWGANGTLEIIKGGPADPDSSKKAQPTEFQSKSAGFYGRMLQSEREYNAVPAGKRDARGYFGQAFHSIAPDAENSLPVWLGGNDANRQMSDQAALNFVRATLRQESGASINADEEAKQYKIFFPMPGDSEQVRSQKAAARQQAMEGFRIASGPLAADIQATTQPVPQKDENGNPIAAAAGTTGGGNPPPAGTDPTKGQIVLGGPPNAWEQAANDQDAASRAGDTQIAQGKTAFHYDNEASQHMWDMYRAGKSEAEINAYAEAKGYQMPAVWPVKDMKARDAQGKNPFYVGKEVPTTTINQIAGGKTGAFVSGAADAASLGFNDELYGLGSAAMGGDYTEARDKFQGAKTAMGENHPGAALTGSLAGGLLTGGLASRVAPGLSAAARANPITSSGVIGATYGAGENNDNRIAGALIGGATGLAGGVLGEKVIAPGLVKAATSRPGQAVINGMSSIPAKARGLVGNALPLDEEAAALVAAGERQGVPVRAPDAVPSKRNAMAAAEASPYGGGLVNNALRSDAQKIEQRVAEIGGPGESASGDMVNSTIGSKAQEASGKYIDRTRLKKNDLYGQAEQLSEGKRVVPENAIAAIDKHIGELEAAGANTNSAQIGYLKGLREDMSKPDGFSISEFQRLRSNASQKIKGDNALTASDADRRLGDVTRSFTADAEAQLPGSAAAKLAEADKYYAQRQDFIGKTLKGLIGTKGRPMSAEDTGKALLAMIRNRADHAKLSGFLKEVDPETRADFSATIAEQLGKNGKGEFSLPFLASNIEKTPSNIRQLLFGDEGNAALKDLQALATAKSETAGGLNRSKSGVVAIRQILNRVLLTGGAGAAGGGVTGAVAFPLLTELAAAIGQKRAAKLLLNPKFTGLLRTAPKEATAEQAQAWLDRVSRIGTSNPVIATEVSNVVPLFQKALGLSPTSIAAQEPDKPTR